MGTLRAWLPKILQFGWGWFLSGEIFKIPLIVLARSAGLERRLIPTGTYFAHFSSLWTPFSFRLRGEPFALHGLIHFPVAQFLIRVIWAIMRILKWVLRVIGIFRACGNFVAPGCGKLFAVPFWESFSCFFIFDRGWAHRRQFLFPLAFENRAQLPTPFSIFILIWVGGDFLIPWILELAPSSHIAGGKRLQVLVVDFNFAQIYLHSRARSPRPGIAPTLIIVVVMKLLTGFSPSEL